MSEKQKILKDNFITRKAGWVQFYADDGSIQKLRSNQVQIVDTLDDDQSAPEDNRRDFDAEEQANIDAGHPDVDDETSTEEDTSATSAAASKPKRAGRAKEKSKMATKKGKASKKTAAKKTAASGGALVRTVGGREHDISGYERVKNASGHTSFDNGDKVATTLRGKTLDEVYDIVSKKVGEPAKDLKSKYKHLNPGMQRMSLGNRLRKVLIPKAAA